MDASSIKRTAQFLTDIGSRRGMLRTAVTGAAASALAGIGLASGTTEEAAAKKKKRCKPKPVGAPCNSNKECCCQTNRICARANSEMNANGMAVSTVCCGTKSASCGTEHGNADCCFGFICNSVTQKCEVTPT
jgi:hypothetical protein